MASRWDGEEKKTRELGVHAVQMLRKKEYVQTKDTSQQMGGSNCGKQEPDESRNTIFRVTKSATTEKYYIAISHLSTSVLL